MGDSEDPMGINDKIEILSTDDDRIKAVGELLSSDSSRAILKLLFNEEMTANQISQKTEISLPLVMYHLKKMQETNVVKIAQTGKNTKSHDMKYYTVDKFAIVILPAGMTEKAKTSKSLFNSFNRIYRFASIGAASLAALFSVQFIQQNNQVAIENARANSGNSINSPEPSQFAPQMAMKSTPAADTAMSKTAETSQAYSSAPTAEVPPPNPTEQITPGPESIPADHTSYLTPNAPTIGDPLHDLALPIIIALSVGIIGLIIERILSSRKKTRNYQV
ncbi:MAG: ArsR family transcriptional regulator [Nitrosopumilaceae archaeon]|nr:ArsR family transcriptional regulator [Nitrosopumilaceae archaeon]